VTPFRSQSLHIVERDVKMILSSEKPRIFKKAVVDICEVLSRISPGRSEGNHGKTQSLRAARRYTQQLDDLNLVGYVEATVVCLRLFALQESKGCLKKPQVSVRTCNMLGF
jgi:hypothetical protein